MPYSPNLFQNRRQIFVCFCILSMVAIGAFLTGQSSNDTEAATIQPIAATSSDHVPTPADFGLLDQALNTGPVEDLTPIVVSITEIAYAPGADVTVDFQVGFICEFDSADRAADAGQALFAEGNHDVLIGQATQTELDVYRGDLFSGIANNCPDYLEAIVSGQTATAAVEAPSDVTEVAKPEAIAEITPPIVAAPEETPTEQTAPQRPQSPTPTVAPTAIPVAEIPPVTIENFQENVGDFTEVNWEQQAITCIASGGTPGDAGPGWGSVCSFGPETADEVFCSVAGLERVIVPGQACSADLPIK